jgi:uncharacterized protein (DUF433 family)
MREIFNGELMENKRITCDPHIKGNKPCIKGTRVPVEVVLEELAAGHSFEKLAQAFLVEREDILACVDFARQTVQDHWQRVLAHPADLEDD